MPARGWWANLARALALLVVHDDRPHARRSSGRHPPGQPGRHHRASGLTALAAVQIQFTDTSNGTVLHQLAEPVTIEISYANLGLTQDQINHLTIYNASENQFLATTIDATRQVAIARSSQFSVFTLAQVTGPIPMVYIPAVSSRASAGW